MSAAGGGSGGTAVAAERRGRSPGVATDRPARARILVAEDDPAAAAVLETLLRLSDYDVQVARDGQTALDALENGSAPDLLLLDWMLPGVSGLEICRAARERWDPVALPILMVTARTDAESIAGAFEAGANDYLTKPFLGSELRSRIASHLRIKQLLEERRRIDEHLLEREKLSSLGVLVSSVAHDLNNPLAAILGHAQLLADGEADPERGELIGEILGGVRQCERIIGDLLAFARRRPVERELLDPREVLAGTIALREGHLRAAGIRLEASVEPGHSRVDGTAHQLQQVFLNLLINAEQALRAGGSSLRVEVREVDGTMDRWVEIAFENDGPPIPPEVLPHIFEPFFTTKPADEGTGLGLAICERIVREHGGEMLVESSEGGTCFLVRLPVARGA